MRINEADAELIVMIREYSVKLNIREENKMPKYQLINTLCESRVFRTKFAISKFNDRDKKELFYSILLSTIALSQDTHTNTWAEKYAGEAAAFSNFDYFRTSGTDLYVLTYVLQNELMLLSKPQALVLIRLYRSISRGKMDRSFIEMTLLRLERMLGISNTQLRNARRIIVNWVKSSTTERKQTITRLHRFVRAKAKLAEVLPYLLVLTKGDKGHFGKMSPLKKAAAFAAAGLAGFVIGYKTHDPNKRMKVGFKDSIEINDESLTEDRPTQLFNLVQNLRSHPDIEKVISVNYIADGISTFVRDTEGNAYEFEIRPAPAAKGHEEKRGVKEERNDPECWDCYDTGYTTEQQWEETVNTPCKCEKSAEFRDRFVQEDVWQWRCIDILNEDGKSLLGKTS